MKKALGLISLLLLFFTGKTIQASQVLGADLSYQCTTTAGVYKVTLKVYRDCNGTTFCSGCTTSTPNGSTTGCTTANAGFSTPIIGVEAPCLGTNYGNYTLTAQSGTNGYDIIQTCDSIKTICTNCNTRTGGTFSSGMEVYIFEGNVNLNSITTSCCKVALAFSKCCRNEAVYNFTPGNFYTECIINRCLTSCNSAPIFTNEAVPLVCAGVDYVYNLGAIDPDGDSLSYAFGTTLQNPGVPVTYNDPYNASYPFAYLGAPNANAPYPAGLRISPTTGDILFRPSGVWVSTLVIEVTQWRKIANTYVNVGVSRRDVQMQTQLCVSNLVPKIKIYKDGILQTSQNFPVYANQQICLDIVAEDQQNLGNFPKPILADTSDLSWNNPGQYIPVMSNAIWTRNYILSQRTINGPKADSFKFCWTPPISAIRNQPYLFTVQGKDRFCPLPASATRGINIKVKMPNGLDSTNRKIFCANKSTSVSMNYTVSSENLTVGNVFSVQLSDSAGSFTNPILVGSKSSTDLAGSINLIIPAGLSTTGNYKLRLNVSADSTALTSIFPISIVPGFSQPVISNNTDSVCKGKNVLLTVLPTNNNYTFKWLLNNNIIPAANNDSLWLDSSGAIKAIVSNTGCSDTSVAKTFTVYPKPIPSFISANIICLPTNPVSFTNTSIISSGTITNYNWKFSDGTTSTLNSPFKNIVDTGGLTVKLIATSNKNCMDSIQKTIAIRKTITPQFSINDSVQCIKNNAFVFTNLSNNQGAVVNYTWNWGNGFITSNNTIQNYSYPNVGNYKVKLITNNGNCTDTLVKNVLVVEPAASVGFTINNNNQCIKNNYFVFTNTSTPNNNTLKYFWHLGNGDTSTQRSPYSTYQIPQVYYVKLLVTANNKCVDSIIQGVILSASPDIANIAGNTIANIVNPFFYSIPAQTNTTYYNWYIQNGSIQSGQSTNAISVLWTSKGTGKLGVLATNTNGCKDSASLNVSINNVGLQDININQELSIYPNPTKSSILISNTNSNLIARNYIISNVIGQILLTGKLNAEETTVNLEALSAGIYLLSIEGISNQSIKVIKE